MEKWKDLDHQEDQPLTINDINKDGSFTVLASFGAMHDDRGFGTGETAIATGKKTAEAVEMKSESTGLTLNVLAKNLNRLAPQHP